MTIPPITLTPLTPRGVAARPLLVLGPSLGTAVVDLWRECADTLCSEVDVVGWDLPGHGGSPPATGALSVEQLAAGVTAAVGEEPFYYAGDSLGGAVGLQLLVAFSDRVRAATVIATGAVIATPAIWRERAALVRAKGTAAVVDGSRERWFAPGFVKRHPQVTAGLLAGLEKTDAESYARCCEALGAFDLRPRLAEITTPLLAVAGALDQVTGPDSLAEIANGVQNGRLEVLPGTAHLPPIEAPSQTAELIKTTLGKGTH